MKTTVIITVLLLLLSAGAFAQNTVPTTFKTVADGSETYGIPAQPINVPPMTLKQNGTTIIDSWNPPIVDYPLNMNLDYIIAADEDRIHLGGHLYKHHDWDNLDYEYQLKYVFNSGQLQTPLVKTANFITPSSIRIHNNFEEYADDGMLSFRDPWFVDQIGNQPDALADFGSPYTPTGKWNEPEAAAFLQQPIQSGLPYYSCNFPVLLDYDRYTQVTTPLQRGQWSLYDIYARNESDADLVRIGERWDYNYTTHRWEREPYRSADIKFNNGGAEVFAFYKAHMQATHEQPPTQGNSQRKIAKMIRPDGTNWYYAVYVSGGRVWCTWTEDEGNTWQPEVLISDFYHTATKPCIAVKSEFASSCPSAVYISYVDENDGTVVLRRWASDGKPDLWQTIDAIDLYSPSLAHPVIAVPSYNDSWYCVLVYEGNKTLQFSMYFSEWPLEGEHETSQGSTPNVVFRDLVLVDGFVNSQSKTFQPEMPAIAHQAGGNNGLNFDIAWREGDQGGMRFKNLRIEVRSGGQDDLIHDGAPAFVPTNNLRIHSSAGPSLTSLVTGASDMRVIAYEINNVGTYPVPTPIPPYGISVLGRTVWPITPNYPIIITPVPSNPGYRVAITHGSSSGPSVAWNRVTKVLNLPYVSSLRSEPVVNYSKVNGVWKVMAAMNYSTGPYATATVQFASTMPSLVFAQRQVTGLWPALSEGSEPLEIYSGPLGLPSPSTSPTPVLQDAIQYDVLETTSGLRKTADVTVSDPMRELVVRKNDSSYALFGIVKPYVLTSGGDRTEVAWNLASDSTEIQWWGEIDDCIKTTPFTVPTGGALEYATELFAAYPSDLDSSAIILVQFRESSSNALLLENAIDMSTYEGDTALYVVDRHDLSSIGGSTVYMCISLADTTTAKSWEVQVITSIDTVQQEKARIAEVPLPVGIHLEQNSPNPFNPATTISYSIDESAYVDLRVYNQLGRCIATLVNEQKYAGFHSVHFTTSELPSGIYFYRLTALGQTTTKKMTLVR